MPARIFLKSFVPAMAVLVALWMPGVCASTAEAQLTSYATGTSSNQAKRDAMRVIPYQELDPAIAQTVSEVVEQPSIYRQLPISEIHSDPDLYLFLIRYPEVVISTWRLMGVTQMAATRTAPFEIQSDDGAGTKMNIELIYGTPHLNIYYAEGTYEGPMLMRTVHGQCVLVLESEYGRDAAGNVVVTSNLHVFLKINNMAANVIAKTLHPLIGPTADHNFIESLKFLEKLSAKSQENGPGVQGMADRLDGLTADVRDQFKDITGIAFERAINRSQMIPATAMPPAGAQPANPYASGQGVISDQLQPATYRQHRSRPNYPR